MVTMYVCFVFDHLPCFQEILCNYKLGHLLEIKKTHTKIMINKHFNYYMFVMLNNFVMNSKQSSNDHNTRVASAVFVRQTV